MRLVQIQPQKPGKSSLTRLVGAHAEALVAPVPGASVYFVAAWNCLPCLVWFL